MNFILLFACFLSLANWLKITLGNRKEWSSFDAVYSMILFILTLIPLVVNFCVFLYNDLDHFKVIKVNMLKLVLMDYFDLYYKKSISTGTWYFCADSDDRVHKFYDKKNILVLPRPQSSTHFRADIATKMEIEDFECDFVKAYSDEFREFAVDCGCNFEMNSDKFWFQFKNKKMFVRDGGHYTSRVLHEISEFGLIYKWFKYLYETAEFQVKSEKVGKILYSVERDSFNNLYDGSKVLGRTSLRGDFRNLIFSLSILKTFRENGSDLIIDPAKFQVRGEQLVFHNMGFKTALDHYIKERMQFYSTKLNSVKTIVFEGEQDDDKLQASSSLTEYLQKIQEMSLFIDLSFIYGENLSDFIINYSKRFWGFLNIKSIKYLINRTSCRNYREIGPNWKSKRYLSDVNYILERSGVPCLTHCDKSVRPSLRIINATDSIPQCEIEVKRKIVDSSLLSSISEPKTRREKKEFNSTKQAFLNEKNGKLKIFNERDEILVSIGEAPKYVRNHYLSKKPKVIEKIKKFISAPQNKFYDPNMNKSKMKTQLEKYEPEIGNYKEALLKQSFLLIKESKNSERSVDLEKGGAKRGKKLSHNIDIVSKCGDLVDLVRSSYYNKLMDPSEGYLNKSELRISEAKAKEKCINSKWVKLEELNKKNGTRKIEYRLNDKPLTELRNYYGVLESECSLIKENKPDPEILGNIEGKKKMAITNLFMMKGNIFRKTHDSQVLINEKAGSELSKSVLRKITKPDGDLKSLIRKGNLIKTMTMRPSYNLSGEPFIKQIYKKRAYIKMGRSLEIKKKKTPKFVISQSGSYFYNFDYSPEVKIKGVKRLFREMQEGQDILQKPAKKARRKCNEVRLNYEKWREISRFNREKEEERKKNEKIERERRKEERIKRMEEKRNERERKIKVNFKKYGGAKLRKIKVKSYETPSEDEKLVLTINED